MFYFLKKNRIKTIANNKLAKYGKYALGEILLVVIGILLALQINSCNQKLIDNKKQDRFLKNIKIDIQSQLKYIDAQISFEIKQKERVDEILNGYYKKSKFEFDSIFFNNTSRLIGRKTFNRNDPTYTALVSTGNISLIKDEKLKSSIFEYYQALEQLENMLRYNNTLYVDQIYKPIILKTSFYYNKNLGWNDKLKKIAINNIKKEENELEMANAISHRAVLANNNIRYLKKIETSTKNILSKLEIYFEE